MDSVSRIRCVPSVEPRPASGVPDQTEHATITERMLNLKEAGYRLRKSPGYIRKHIKAGNIRAVRIGRTWFVSEDEIARIQREGLPILKEAIRKLNSRR